MSAGELARATSLVEELGTVAEATRSSSPPQGAIALAACQGREAETLSLVEAHVPELMKRGEGMGVSMAQWALGVLYNGLGCYDEAVVAAGQALADPQPLGLAGWARIELVEAAVRSGNVDLAADALEGSPTETAEPTGHLESMPARVRWWDEATPPRTPTARRSRGWAGAGRRRCWRAPPGLWRMAAPRASSPRGGRAAARRARDADGHGHGGVRSPR